MSLFYIFPTFFFSLSPIPLFSLSFFLFFLLSLVVPQAQDPQIYALDYKTFRVLKKQSNHIYELDPALDPNLAET